jgi:DNA (cytosine-5)-methyltransferase 1
LWKFGDNGVTRRFSWREAAVIQTFPQNLDFYGDLTSKYKQIGNAVPVKLASYVASYLYNILDAREEKLDWQMESRLQMEKRLSMLVS